MSDDDVLTCPGCSATFHRLHPVMHSVEGYCLDGARYCTARCAAEHHLREVRRLRGFLHELEAQTRAGCKQRQLAELALHTTQTMRELRVERARARKD